MVCLHESYMPQSIGEKEHANGRGIGGVYQLKFKVYGERMMRRTRLLAAREKTARGHVLVSNTLLYEYMFSYVFIC